ncbi:hypothetical protein ACFOKI_12695 [Sphingomonas qilianensis]|uniref:Uncharacterized protein n=1 Tax=Sphingomonas qilianensis TaxID=1736690 RepID=A0ABU9XNK7_9SPHN
MRLFNTNTARAGVAVIRAGSLDRSDELDVPVHAWVKRKQPWLVLPKDAEMFEDASTMEVLFKLFAR